MKERRFAGGHRPLKMRIQKEKLSFFEAIEVDGKKVTAPVEDGELYINLGDPGKRANLVPNALEYDWTARPGR